MIIAFDNSSSPSGLIWDGDNCICAYDSLLTILYEIWSTDTKVWTRIFKEINQYHLKSVSACFKKYMNGQTSFETAGRTIRHKIHSHSCRLSTDLMPDFNQRCKSCTISLWNQRHKGFSFSFNNFYPLELCVAISSPECTSCEYSEPSIDDRLGFVLYMRKKMHQNQLVIGWGL